MYFDICILCCVLTTPSLVFFCYLMFAPFTQFTSATPFFGDPGSVVCFDEFVSLCFVSLFVTCFIFHTSEIVQFLAFLVRLFALSRILSGSPPCCPELRYFVLSVAGCYSSVRKGRIFLALSPAGGHTGGLHVSAVVTRLQWT